MIEQKNIIKVEVLTVKCKVTGMVWNYSYLETDEGTVITVRNAFMSYGNESRIRINNSTTAKREKQGDVEYFKKEGTRLFLKR